MKHVLVAVAVGMLLGLPVRAEQPDSPKVIGLLFYADWCGSCKVLEPNLNAVKKDFPRPTDPVYPRGSD